MNRKTSYIILPLIILFSISFLYLNNSCSKQRANNDPALTNSELKIINGESGRQLIRKKMSEMTLREKIAQMVISSYIPENWSENSADFKKAKKLVEEEKIGGFIFFRGSTTDYALLSNALQKTSSTPLLISADFERGTGMRVTDGTLFPNNMAIGATNNTELAYKMGVVIAKESRAMGVGQDYAPVCDVNNNPNNPIINVRSFGESPELVSKMSQAMIKGLQDNKIIATSKHFPGHGDTEIDSHKDLPVLNFTLERLNEIELVPFKNAIDNGVMSVMIAHLSFPALEPDPKIPASLSPNIVQNLLLDKMNFKGLVVTDALNMQGITKYYNTKEVAIMCVKAGIDLILMPMSEVTTIDAIEQAVQNNSIPEERINSSVEKILSAKMWLGLFDNKLVDAGDLNNQINTKESNDLAQKIADESITLVKDDNNTIPIKDKKSKILVLNMSDGKDNINSGYFSKKCLETYPSTDIIDLQSEINIEKLNEILSTASGYDYVIASVFAKVKYGTGKISLPPSQINLINKLPESNRNLIVISLGNPYLLKEFGSVPNYICTYGDADVSINAVLKALSGDIRIKGILPVSLNDSYKQGSGIQK